MLYFIFFKPLALPALVSFCNIYVTVPTCVLSVDLDKHRGITSGP